jgi:N-acetylglucosamine malate deacetylase 1
MPSVLAIAAHHDDIEFVMAGTMLLLKERGWELHYMDLADGSRGSTQLDPKTCAATRLAEAQEGAKILGATFYPPIFPDMEIQYSTDALQKVASVVRQTRASVILTHAPVDYMTDHEEACKLAVSAAFCHGMPNFETTPQALPYFEPVTVYHAQPHGNRTPMGEVVRPHFAVDISSVLERKLESLRAHRSQQEWLDSSQKMNSYVQSMLDLCGELAGMTGKYKIAEGWRRRQHWGFCGPNDDPLRDALRDVIHNF